VSASPSENARAQIELHCLHLRAGCSVPDTVLSLAERQRAAAFRSCEAARLFVAGRLLCRSILAEITGCTPKTLSIAVSSDGRPYLPGHPHIDFNLSHTAGTVALAICRAGRVGIDIERPETYGEAEMQDLVQLVLSEEEGADLRQLPPSQRPTAFFALWVGKEAVLKCRGRGLLDDPRWVNTTKNLHRGPGNLGDGRRVHTGEEPGYLWAVATEAPTRKPVWQHHDDVDRLIRRH
jgi:4'-phosphopantetheinyl transferase